MRDLPVGRAGRTHLLMSGARRVYPRSMISKNPKSGDRVAAQRTLQPYEVPPFAAQLLKLQHDAYAVEAALIGDDRIPPLHETESDLIAAGLHWLLQLDDGRIVGAVGYSVTDDELDIDRLIVHPGHHRRGIGRRLVEQALTLAPRASVSTGRSNTPARHLYERLGFRHDGDRQVLPGLVVSEYSYASA